MCLYLTYAFRCVSEYSTDWLHVGAGELVQIHPWIFARVHLQHFTEVHCFSHLQYWRVTWSTELSDAPKLKLFTRERNVWMHSMTKLLRSVPRDQRCIAKWKSRAAWLQLNNHEGKFSSFHTTHVFSRRVLLRLRDRKCPRLLPHSYLAAAYTDNQLLS